MKILHIVPSYKPAYIYGGTIESVARLCEMLAESGNQVTVYTTTANGMEELPVQPGKAYEIDGVSVFYFRRATKDPLHFSVSLLRKLYKHCREFDVVHIHSWWNLPSMLGAYVCKLRGVKTIFSPHGMLSDYIISHSNSLAKRFVHRLFGVWLLKYMRLHTTSGAEMNECRQIIPGWKGAVIYNLNRLPEIAIARNRNEMLTLFFLSRIHPKKGLDLLLEAIACTRVPLRLQIAGSGNENYMAFMHQKAKKLGIENIIQWQGWLNHEEKFKALMQADLFVLTSYNENFANVVIEALHVGTPVLLTEGVGLSKFVEDNDLGWITKPEPAAIKNTLELAIADNEKRTRIAAVAPCIVQKNFSPAILIPQYQRLYASLLQ